MTTTVQPTSSTSSENARPDRDKDRWEAQGAATDRDKDRWEANAAPDRDKDRWEANAAPDRDKDRWEAQTGGAMQRLLQPSAIGRWLLALGTMAVGVGVLMMTRAVCCQDLSDVETIDGAAPAL